MIIFFFRNLNHQFTIQICKWGRSCANLAKVEDNFDEKYENRAFHKHLLHSIHPHKALLGIHCTLISNL